MATTDRRGATVSAADPATPTNPSPDLAIKAPVRVATTGGNINLQTFGLGVIDGVQLVAGDRVLVKDETDPTTNGIYNASTGVWTRAVDASNNSQWAQGTLVEVTQGATLSNSIFAITSANPIALGTSALTFVASLKVGLNVGSSVIAGGTSTSAILGLLYNNNGVLGDTSKGMPNLADAQASGEASVVISGNSSVLPATGVGGVNGYTPTMMLASADNRGTVFFIGSYGDEIPSLVLSNVAGSAASPSATQNFATSNLSLGVIGAAGWGSTKATNIAAAISFIPYENFTDAAQGTGIRFYTQRIGHAEPSSDLQEALTILPSGGFVFPSTVTGGDPGLGGINATAIKQGGVAVATLNANTFAQAQTITLNQNNETQLLINNNSAGTAADASIFASNGTGGLIAGVGGTGNTALSSLVQNKGFIYSTTGAAGLVLNARSTNPIIFATNDTEKARIASGGNVGIGNNNPQYLFCISNNVTQGILGFSNPADGATLQIVGADAGRAGVEAVAFASQAVIRGSRADGTAASKSALAGANEAILNFSAYGWDGANFVNGGAFIFWSSEAWTAGAHGGCYGTIYTTPTTTQATAEAVRFQASGGVSIGLTTDPGIGNLTVNGVYKVGSTQVVGAHITGYAAMTGTPDKASAFATSTVTLAQLAGRVMQIQADLTTHGLIGA